MFNHKPVIIERSENTFSYTNDARSILQFVKNNKRLPALLAQCKLPTQQDNIQSLLSAIASGNLRDPIFDDVNAHIYAIFLLDSKQISMVDFLDVNFYLSLCQQYTDKQPLKSVDASRRCLVNIEILNMTEMADIFISRFTSLREYKYNDKVTEENIRACIAKLSNLSRNVIRISKKNLPPSILREYEHHLAYVFMDESYYYVALPGFVEEAIKLLNPDYPLKMAPIFGQVSIPTLFAMHQQGFHPVSLYSTYVISNVTIVHEHESLPFESLSHDIYVHTYWGNLLSANDYAFLHDVLMPTVAKLTKVTHEELIKQSRMRKRWQFFNAVDLNFSDNYPGEEIPKNYYLSLAFHNLAPTYPEYLVLYRTLLGRVDEIEAQYKINLRNIFVAQVVLQHYQKTETDFMSDVVKVDCKDVSFSSTTITRVI